MQRNEGYQYNLLLNGKSLVSKVVLIVDFLKPGWYGALKNISSA